MKIQGFLNTVLQGQSVTRTPSVNAGASGALDVRQKLLGDVEAVFEKHGVTPDTQTLESVQTFVDNAADRETALKALDVALLKGIEPTPGALSDIEAALRADQVVPEALAFTPDAETELAPSERESLIRAMKLPAAIRAEIRAARLQGGTLREAVAEVLHRHGIIERVDGTLKALLTEAAAFYAEHTAEGTGAHAFASISAASPLTEAASSAPWNLLSDGDRGEVPMRRGGAPRAVLAAGAPMDADMSLSTDAQGKAVFGRMEDVSRDQAVPDRRSEHMAVQGAPNPEAAPAAEDQWAASDDASTEAAESTESIERLVQQALEGLTVSLDRTLGQGLDIKVYLVEQTTRATEAARAEFELFQKNTLDTLHRVLETPAAPVSLDRLIDDLNKVVLKSQFARYADMHTERQLMLFATDLEKAAALLRSGDGQGARALVGQVESRLKSMVFEPSLRSVQAFATGKLHALETAFEARPIQLQQYMKAGLSALAPEGTAMGAREVLEALRFSGLNHEMEVAEVIERGERRQWSQANVKEILLKLMKDDRDPQTVKAASQGLMSFSGQQMMNDSGGDRRPPFQYFNVPFVDGDDLNQMTVYMKGRSRRAQMDWQNAQLYFGMDLADLGPLGVRADVHQGVVRLTVLTDAPDAISERFLGIETYLSEVGYSVGAIEYSAYTRWAPAIPGGGSGDGGEGVIGDAEPSEGTSPSTAQKGRFDFRI